LGEGRLDESGDFTKGAGLKGKAVDQVLDFVQAGSKGGRSATLDNIARVVAGSAEGDEGLLELSRIDAALTSLGIADDQAFIDPSIVRGLEYYTGAVFEAELLLSTTDEKGNKVTFGSIGGGGRYDDLVARFTGNVTPATGFSFGVSRLAAALRAAGREPGGSARGPVVVIAFDDAHMPEYFKVVGELRAAGISAEVYLGTSGMRPQMKYADRRLSPAAIMLGGDEIAAGTVTIKDLDLGRELASGVADNAAWKAERPGQQTIPRGELVSAVRKIISNAVGG
jgi:histidyl-tRNA synthetase